MASGFHRSIVAPLARGFLLLSVHSNNRDNRLQDVSKKPRMFWTFPKRRPKEGKEEEVLPPLVNLVAEIHTLHSPIPQPMEQVRQATNRMIPISFVVVGGNIMPSVEMLVALAGVVLVFLVAHLLFVKGQRGREVSALKITYPFSGEDTLKPVNEPKTCINEQADIQPVVATESQECTSNSSLHHGRVVVRKEDDTVRRLMQANQRIAELEAQLQLYHQLDDALQFDYDKEIPEPNRVLSPEKTHSILDMDNATNDRANSNSNKARRDDYEVFAEELAAAAEWIQEKEHLSTTIEALRQQLDVGNELLQTKVQLQQARTRCQELTTSLETLQTTCNEQKEQLEEMQELRRVDLSVMDILHKDNASFLFTIQKLRDNLKKEQTKHHETVQQFAKDKTKQNIRFHLTP
jgi:hypothetical protein